MAPCDYCDGHSSFFPIFVEIAFACREIPDAILYIVNLAECLGLILLFLLFTHNPINYQKANLEFVFEIWDLR